MSLSLYTLLMTQSINNVFRCQTWDDGHIWLTTECPYQPFKIKDGFETKWNGYTGTLYPNTCICQKLVIFLILVIESSGKVYLLTQLTLYPAGSVSVLPTILCLTTNVLRETAEPSLDGKSAPTVTSCMQALRSLATCSFVKDPRCANDWEKFLQSTLATILDYSNPGIKLSSFTGRTNFSKLSSI